MTEKEYRNHPAISRSELFKITDSPEKFQFYKDNPQSPTPALIFGQAFHKMALEPENFYDEFAIMPNCDRRTTEGKKTYSEFVENSAEKTVISETDAQTIAEMCETLRNNKYACKLLNGEHEKPFFWTDDMTGEECKCRVDCITEISDIPIVIDVKSAESAQTDKFMRDAVNYGYDFQTGMYLEGVDFVTKKKHGFVFIVIEKKPPYAINILQADKLFIQRGRDIFRELIGIYHDCKQTGEWYGYLGKYNVINNLSLPVWLAKEIE